MRNNVHRSCFDRIDAAFDLGACRAHNERIWNRDSRSSFDAYERTAEYCERALRDAGLTQIERLSVRADGHTRYGDWVIPRAWDVREAHLMRDDGVLLADYRAQPASLIMYSPKVSARARAVALDDLADADERLRGTVIVTRLAHAQVLPVAARYGAVAVVSDYFPLYEGVRSDRSVMRGHCRWVNDCVHAPVPGYSLAPEVMDALRLEMSRREVWLDAYAETRRYDGECYTVSGVIKGRGEGEVLLWAHLYEVGANDNASGCALLLALAAALARERWNGRTLRFAMGWECTGSMALFQAHPERWRHPGCALVADMVGTLGMDYARAGIWHNPLSNYSFTDALLPDIARECVGAYGGETFGEHPFSILTDNIMSDPALNTPTATLMHYEARSYHSSMDTPEHIENEALMQSARVIGAFALQAAHGDMRPFEARARAEAETRIRAALAFPAPDWPLAMSRPKRAVLGPLTFDARPDLRARYNPAWNDALNLPLFWANGRRTLWEIACLTCAERATPTNADCEVKFRLLSDYFAFLAEEGFVEWGEKAHNEVNGTIFMPAL